MGGCGGCGRCPGPGLAALRLCGAGEVLCPGLSPAGGSLPRPGLPSPSSIMQPLLRAPAGAARNNGSGCERPPPHPPLRPALCQELASHGGASTFTFTGTSRCCCSAGRHRDGGPCEQPHPGTPGWGVPGWAHPEKTQGTVITGIVCQEGAQAGTPSLAEGPCVHG